MSSADGVVRASAGVGGGLGGDPNLYILIVVVLVSAVTFVCSALGKFCSGKLLQPKQQPQLPSHHSCHQIQPYYQCSASGHPQCYQQRQCSCHMGAVCPQPSAPAQTSLDSNEDRTPHDAGDQHCRPAAAGQQRRMFNKQRSNVTLGHHPEGGRAGNNSSSNRQHKMTRSNTSSGTFHRLGIGQNFSTTDLQPLARHLENKALSPIHQTPPQRPMASPAGKNNLQQVHAIIEAGANGVESSVDTAEIHRLAERRQQPPLTTVPENGQERVVIVRSNAVTSHAGNPAVARRGVTVTPGSRTSKSTQTGAGGARGGNGYYTTFLQATNQTAPSGVTTGSNALVDVSEGAGGGSDLYDRVLFTPGHHHHTRSIRSIPSVVLTNGSGSGYTPPPPSLPAKPAAAPINDPFEFPANTSGSKRSGGRHGAEEMEEEEGDENEPLLHGNPEEVRYQRSQNIPPILGDPGMTSPTPGNLVEAFSSRTPQLRNIDFEDEFEDDRVIPDEDEAQGATIRHLLPTAPSATATTSIVQNRNNSLSRVSQHSPTLRPSTDHLLVPPTDASSAHPSSSSSREFLRPTAVAAALLTPPPDDFPTSLHLSSNASATRSSSLPTPQRLDTAQLYSNGAGNQDRSRVPLQRAASCGTCGQPWPTGTQDPSGRSEGSSDSASMAQLTEGMFQIQPKVETTTQNARKMHQFETQAVMSGDGASRSDLPRLYHTAAEGLAMSSGGDSSIQLFEPRPQHTTATGGATNGVFHEDVLSRDALSGASNNYHSSMDDVGDGFRSRAASSLPNTEDMWDNGGMPEEESNDEDLINIDPDYNPSHEASNGTLVRHANSDRMESQ